MKNVCMIIFAALLVVVLGSMDEPLESSETFTQVYPFAERAFFYYPNGAGGYFNRAGNPPPSSVDFADNPFDAAAANSPQDMVPNPAAAFFVPTSDLLAMPYPSKIDQEADEKAAMKHLEMLKELHDQLEKSEQKFLKPSLSFGGNGVTLPMNAFVSMLHKLSKTITKTVTTTTTTIQLTTVFMNTSSSSSVSETSTDPIIVVTNTDTKATSTATPIIETTTAAIVTPTPVLETTPVIETTPVVESTSVIETTAAAIETTTAIPVQVTTSTPLVIVTTITTTIL